MPQFLRLQEEVAHLAGKAPTHAAGPGPAQNRVDLTRGTADQAAAALRRYGFG